MDARKREVRTTACELAVRESAQDAQGESRTIVGRAIVFGAESEVLDDWGYRFREVIAPEAVTKEWLSTQDVKMNMLHDRSLTIARCNKGVGSMRLSVDKEGVSFEFEAPRCDIGERCLEMVRRGDYSGCSFEFYPDDFAVEEREGGKEVKITHRKFGALTSLTIGMDPAYRQTSVNVREALEQGAGGKEQEDEEAATVLQHSEQPETGEEPVSDEPVSDEPVSDEEEGAEDEEKAEAEREEGLRLGYAWRMRTIELNR